MKNKEEDHGVTEINVKQMLDSLKTKKVINPECCDKISDISGWNEGDLQRDKNSAGRNLIT